MTYAALRFDVEAADGDAWSDAMLEAGALSVEAVDACAGTAGETAVFDERNDGNPQWWPISRLTALLGDGSDPAVVMAGAAALVGHAAPAYQAFAVADQDWVHATQAQFQPIRIDDEFWIVPTWCTPPRADALNLRLDPGLAFGTGAHPTTRLCLEWLRVNVGADTRVLDYGCGSGILAIAAGRLGARRVVGTDIDPQAIQASVVNARLNQIDAAFMEVDELPAERFDIVIANILANPLRLLAPALATRIGPQGWIALAGILAAQATGVAAAYARWFDMRMWRSDGDWVLLAGRRLPETGRR